MEQEKERERACERENTPDTPRVLSVYVCMSVCMSVENPLLYEAVPVL